MLPEESRVYAGRGSSEAERLRGYILASFEARACRPRPPFCARGTRNRTEPVYRRGSRACAARSIDDPRRRSRAPRRRDRATAGKGRCRVVRSLCSRATSRATGQRASTSWRRLRDAWASASSALPALKALVEAEGTSFSPPVSAQLAKAIEALSSSSAGPGACCCDEPVTTEFRGADRAPSVAPLDVAGIALENQDGIQLSFSEAFSGRPTALAFFYTRCMNPEKCSLTVTRLGRLARLLERVALTQT